MDGKFGFPALPSVETVKYKNNEKFIDECYFKLFREKDSIHSGEHMMGFTSLESYLFNGESLLSDYFIRKYFFLTLNTVLVFLSDMSAYNRVGSFAKWVLTYLNAKVNIQFMKKKEMQNEKWSNWQQRFPENLVQFCLFQELLKPVAVKIFDAQIDLKQKYMLQYGNPKAVYYYYFSYLSKTNRIEGRNRILEMFKVMFNL